MSPPGLKVSSMPLGRSRENYWVPEWVKRLNFTQGHHQMVSTEIKLITFFVARNRESQNKTWSWLEAQVISFSAEFRLKLKKTRKNARPARYDLNQIPYEFAVEVRDRLKGLDLVNSVPEEPWTELCNIVQKATNKTAPKKKKSKKAKWLSEEALQIAEEWREVKSKGERENYIQLNAEFQRIPRRDKTAFNEQCILI